MAISCFTGKPGNGKTLTMMHFLAEDLIRTERHVVTNIPIKLEELGQYLEEECDRRKCRVPKLHRRLTVLDTTEALYFWRYRSGGFILPAWDGKTSDGKVLPEEELLIQSSDYFKQIGQKPEYSVPCSYFISEAHRYYNAKRFQRISVIAELYVTHHRHLHDEVYFDTQFAKQLAVSLRELTEEWHVLRNDYHRNIGFVKMIPRIRMASYYEMPSGGDNKPFDKRSIHIRENGVAGCYNSTAALGAIERAQDVEEKKPKKGIDLRVFVGLVTMGIIALFCTLAFAPRVVFGAIFQPGETSNENIPGTQDSTTNPNLQSTNEAQAVVYDPPGDYSGGDRENVELLTLRSFGAMQIDGEMTVWATLSDGRQVTHEHPLYQGVNVSQRQIRFDGQVVGYVPTDPHQATQASF